MNHKSIINAYISEMNRISSLFSRKRDFRALAEAQKDARELLVERCKAAGDTWQQAAQILSCAQQLFGLALKVR